MEVPKNFRVLRKYFAKTSVHDQLNLASAMDREATKQLLGFTSHFPEWPYSLDAIEATLDAAEAIRKEALNGARASLAEFRRLHSQPSS